MQIAYFAHLNDGRASGVVSKIAAQLSYWRREGHTVTAFVATTDVDDSWHGFLGDIVVRRYRGPVSRLRAMVGLVRAIRAFGPRVIYFRWELFYPPMFWFPDRVPLVAEINTNDLAEYALGSMVRARYNALTRSYLLRRAAALVFADGWELSRLPAFAGFPARHEVITNGIDLAAYPSLPGPGEGPPRLAFVGSGDVPWNGIDKIVALAEMRPEWQIDVVGLVEPMRSAPNVRWHGQLDRGDVLNVLGHADVGIGTLALHRKSMNEVCALKVREYMAVGLPILNGCADPDLDEIGQYALRIPNTETNVFDELDRIDAFVHWARGARVPRALVAHIDVSRKEGQRLALFNDLAGI